MDHMILTMMLKVSQRISMDTSTSPSLAVRQELSQVGKMATKKVSQRLQDMLKVCNAMKSHMECEVIGKNIKKAETAEMLKIQSGLNDVCCDLKKQMLSKTPVNMEKAKTSLLAGAKAIREGKAFVRKI